MSDLVLKRSNVALCGTATGNGPTVLLLHAGGERRAVWAPVMDGLNRRRLRTVAFDLRGHGDSAGSATSLRTLAGDVRAMIRSEEPPVAVVGASLGGLAAVAAVGDRHTAERVAGLVLVDVVPDPDPVRVRRWLDSRGLRARQPELVEDILAQGRDLLSIAARFSRPMLLVLAGNTPLSDADVNRLRAAKRRLTVAPVPGAGHLVARDAPEELACIIAEHVSAWMATEPPDARIRKEQP